MTREEAQALAEREVLEYARSGNLKVPPGVDPIARAAAVLLAGTSLLEAQLYGERVEIGHVTAIAALCIELLRECHLKHYNQKPAAEA